MGVEWGEGGENEVDVLSVANIWQESCIVLGIEKLCLTLLVLFRSPALCILPLVSLSYLPQSSAREGNWYMWAMSQTFLLGMGSRKYTRPAMTSAQ